MSESAVERVKAAIRQLWRRNMTPRDWMIVAGASVIALVLSAALIWRQDILQSTLDPKEPFQTYHPPAAPDYAAPGAWALLPATPATWTAADPPADVFFVHPTTFDGGRDWNGSITDERSNRFLTGVILPNYAGPFVRVGRIFAPRYRQASVYTSLTLREDAREAREFAYEDVRRAFDYYLDHFSHGRPLVIAGVEQGATLIDRLIHDEVAARPGLVKQIAAVYLIDATSLAAGFAPGSPLPACAARAQAHCVVGWTQSFAFDQADIRQTLHRSLVWGPTGHLEDTKDRPFLCVNPLLGVESDTPAPARLNRGAVAASDIEWGARPAFMTRQVSAQCVDGVLRVSAPPSPSLKQTGGWVEHLKEPGYNLFYADEEADAQARVATLLGQPGQGIPAPPITTVIDIKDAPVHRAN
jgi:hypothetical protein